MSEALPLVYSCSGCSSAAQMANSLAIKLDRDGHAEMSCIAGVGGGVAPLVRVAKSGRPIIALDGCALKCVEHCLARHGVIAEKHIVLSDWDVPKKKKTLFSDAEIDSVYARLRDDLKNADELSTRQQMVLGQSNPGVR